MSNFFKDIRSHQDLIDQTVDPDECEICGKPSHRGSCKPADVVKATDRENRR